MVERERSETKESVSDLNAENFALQIQLSKYEREVEFLYKVLQEKGFQLNTQMLADKLSREEPEEGQMMDLVPSKELVDKVWTIQNYGQDTLKF